MDASVGLVFSLQIFQRYKRSGVLQATIRRLPGVQGVCTASIYLTDGSVAACFVENKLGQHIPFSVDDLCRTDSDRGPFEWVFREQPSLPRPQVPSILSPDFFTPLSPPQSGLDTLIPRVIAPLRWERFSQWTPEQKQLLQHVWKYIDGKHTIYDLKTHLPYPPLVLQDVLQILLELHLIMLGS